MFHLYNNIHLWLDNSLWFYEVGGRSGCQQSNPLGGWLADGLGHNERPYFRLESGLPHYGRSRGWRWWRFSPVRFWSRYAGQWTCSVWWLWWSIFGLLYMRVLLCSWCHSLLTWKWPLRCPDPLVSYNQTNRWEMIINVTYYFFNKIQRIFSLRHPCVILFLSPRFISSKAPFSHPNSIT